jgi:foldase protein PrsA
MSSRKLQQTVLGMLVVGAALFALPVCGQSAAPIPDPVAKINGQPVSREVFLDKLMAYHGVYVLQNLFGEMLLEAEAKKRGATVTDAELTARINEVRKSLGIDNAETFRAWLTQREETESSFRDRQQLALLIEKTFAADANVTASEVEDFYNKNKASFTVEANITYWTLATRTDELAQKGLQLIKSGKDFPAAAKELGPGMGNATGPVVQALKNIAPAYKSVLEKASPGQILGPLKVPQNPQDPNSPAVGYYVIKVEAKEAERTRTFNEVKDDIRRGMFSQRIFGPFGIWESWTKREMEKANIERFVTFKGEPTITK